MKKSALFENSNNVILLVVDIVLCFMRTKIPEFLIILKEPNVYASYKPECFYNST